MNSEIIYRLRFLDSNGQPYQGKDELYTLPRDDVRFFDRLVQLTINRARTQITRLTVSEGGPWELKVSCASKL